MIDKKFVQGLAKYMGEPSAQAVLDKRTKYSYQLYGPIRAQNEINFIMNASRLEDVKGLSVLDIEFAFGASLKEWSKRGARVSGIEINKRAYEIATFYLSDEIAANIITMVLGDAATQKTFAKLEKFDIVILSDLFEHVYNTNALIKNINAASTPGALLYFNIPNHYYPDYIIQEPHKKFFGLTLLPPDLWQKVGIPPGWSIYHRDFEHYDFLLRAYNFFSKRNIRHRHKRYGLSF